MANAVCINVEVAYATRDEQQLISLELNADATVGEAIQQSAILTLFPALIIDELVVGIFSKKVTLDHKLQAGDRIEIYRPLTLDPMTARRQRVKLTNQRARLMKSKSLK